MGRDACVEGGGCLRATGDTVVDGQKGAELYNEDEKYLWVVRGSMCVCLCPC